MWRRFERRTSAELATSVSRNIRTLSRAIVERKSRIGGVRSDQSSRYAPPTCQRWFLPAECWTAAKRDARWHSIVLSPLSVDACDDFDENKKSEKKVKKVYIYIVKQGIKYREILKERWENRILFRILIRLEYHSLQDKYGLYKKNNIKKYYIFE